MAVELTLPPGLDEDSAPGMAVDNQVAAVAREMGLFVRPMGGTILLGPPLIFTRAQAERTVEVLDVALSQVEAASRDPRCGRAMNASATSGRAAHERTSRSRRLTSLDLMFLRFESPAWPCHFAGLAVVDGKALVDEAGRLRLAELTDRTSRRLASVPELRRRLHFPGILRGGPLWVDDDRFDIRNHIHQAAAEPPGGDAELLELAARLDERQLDRARPLWELWFLTGLRDGRVGVLLKLHHCVADGTGSRGPDGIAVRRRIG